MQYSPPPLFKQGASARVKVIVFALIAIALLVVDSRMKSLSTIRQMVGAALFPLQTLALAPRDAAYAVGDYFSSLRSLQRENSGLKHEQIANGQALQQGQYLLAENAHLRQLLAASERLPVKSVMSEILYDTRDAFSRKLVLDRGMRHGIVAGQPVIDDIGVVGQITRVFPFTSEVTLLTDKNHAISVQVIRSGVRSVAYGRGQVGVLDLRFIAANADIQKGDVLVTSGIDGVYPPGLAVAKVTQVEHKSGDAFAGIVCEPTAGINRHKQLLILLTEARSISESTTAGVGTEHKTDVKPGASGPAAAAAAKSAEKTTEKAGKAPAASGAAAIQAPVPATTPAAAKKAAPAAPATKPVPPTVAPATPATPARSGSMAPLPAAAKVPAVPAAPVAPKAPVGPASTSSTTQLTPAAAAKTVTPNAPAKAVLPVSVAPQQQVASAPGAVRPSAGGVPAAAAVSPTGSAPINTGSMAPVPPVVKPSPVKPQIAVTPQAGPTPAVKAPPSGTQAPKATLTVVQSPPPRKTVQVVAPPVPDRAATAGLAPVAANAGVSVVTSAVTRPVTPVIRPGLTSAGATP